MACVAINYHLPSWHDNMLIDNWKDDSGTGCALIDGLRADSCRLSSQQSLIYLGYAPKGLIYA